MSTRLRTAHECLSQSGGQRLAEANNVGAVGPAGPFGLGRSKGALYILVEAAGVAKDETERELVDLLANEYDRAKGSITASLRQAIAAANHRLYTQNQKALPEMRMAAGVTCAVIRDTDVFLAQAGPALAYVLHQDTLQRSPVDSPWLSPDRAAAFPYMFPLGKRPEVDPELFHSVLQTGDTLLLSTVSLAQRIPQAQIKEILSKGSANLIIRQIAALAGGEDFTVVALEVMEEAQEEEAPLAESEGGPEMEAAEPVGLLGRLREDWQVMLEDVSGFLGRLLQPLRGRSDTEAIEVPEVPPVRRRGLVEPGPTAPPLAEAELQASSALPPWEGEPSAPRYEQVGFAPDVVAPRMARQPVPEARLVGGDVESTLRPAREPETREQREPVQPREAEPGGGASRVHGAASAVGAVGAAAAQATNGLRSALGGLSGRLRRGTTGSGTPLTQVGADRSASSDAGSGRAQRPLGGTGDSLVGVPWRGAPRAESELERAEDVGNRRWRLPALPGNLSLVAVAVLALVAVLVGGLALVRYQEDQARGKRFAELMQMAQEKRSLVTPTMGRAAARDTLSQAEQALNQALELRPDDPDAKALYEGIRASLDSVDGVVRLANVTTLVEVPETQAKLGRVIVNGIDLFFLDTGQNRVYKYLFSSPAGTALQKLDVNPVLVRKGDEVGNVVAGDLLDIVWMPPGGMRSAGRFMALESGGSLLEYDPTGGMRSLVVRDSQTWRKPKAISSFQGNFYVMDTQQNSIFKYEPTARGYENIPIEWLKTSVDLTNMVDMAIDGDIYLLGLDGRIQRFRGGLALPYTQPDLDRPMTNPASLFTAPEVKSLYVVDPANQRIVQLGKEGGFQRQYRYSGKDGAFDALRGVYVDEEQGRMYLTSGKKVLVATIPR